MVQGASHGGVYIVDVQAQSVQQMLDWNTTNIDWQGRGWDRGLRGIAFAGERVYIAASDELFAYSPSFELLGSWRNPFLKHCHEIFVWGDHLFLSSTGFDTILGFNLTSQSFDWALHIDTDGMRFRAGHFDPHGDKGPLMLNKLHINTVFCNDTGMFISGLNTGGVLHFDGKTVDMFASLPAGTHNARPYRDGVLFNDTQADCVRFASRNESEDRVFKVPTYATDELTGVNIDDSRIARAGFGRGLCEINNQLIAAGSSPSTIALHDMVSGKTALSVRISSDIRNAIHGLEVWPF